MDYKEKYEQAIERCKKEFNFNNLAYSHEEIKQRLERVFPELKENEDERIRRFISNELACLRAADEKGSDRYEELTDAIAWLEKQGEQNPVDNVKPKFNVGDWIVKGDVVAQILDNQKYAFVGLDTKGNDFICNYSHADSIHLWNIQDAKDGDVLVIEEDERNDECIFIFKSVAARKIIEYCYLRSNNTFSPTGSFIGYDDDNYHPATKEQRDLLFTKMKKAGYEWDAEKKELRKIDKKLAWSKEDETFFNTALWHISYSISNGESTNIHCSTTDWLKSIKERMKEE